MTDWADEVVKTLVTGYQIAAALRKAKADGMREAANHLRECGECDCDDHANEIDRVAARVEQPR